MITVLLDHYILFISKTTGYINKFGKNKILSLMIKDIQLFKKYNKIWKKIEKLSYMDIGIYNIGYITIKKIGDCKNIYSVNPLYLCITHASGYIKEKGVNKYLSFDSVDENKELLKNYNDVFDRIRDKIKETNSDDCNC